MFGMWCDIAFVLNVMHGGRYVLLWFRSNYAIGKTNNAALR